MNQLEDEKICFAFRLNLCIDIFKHGVISINKDKMSDINYLWEKFLMVSMYIRKKEDIKMSD